MRVTAQWRGREPATGTDWAHLGRSASCQPLCFQSASPELRSTIISVFVFLILKFLAEEEEELTLHYALL